MDYTVGVIVLCLILLVSCCGTFITTCCCRSDREYDYSTLNNYETLNEINNSVNTTDDTASLPKYDDIV